MSIFKTIFEPIESSTTIRNRVASPIELFFDLIFAAGIGATSHFLMHVNFWSVLLAIIVFVSMYIVWMMFSLFCMRFWGSSYIIRILLFFIMIPLVLFASITDSSVKSLHLLLIAFSLSRFALSISWLTALKFNYKIFDASERYELITISTCFSITALSAFMANLLFKISLANTVKILGGLLVLELCTWLVYNFIRDKKKSQPTVSYELLKERHILFGIIVFGEGLISVVSGINWNNSHILEGIILIILSFSIVFFFFLRVYEEFIRIQYTKKNIVSRLFFHMIICFILMILYASMRVVITNPYHVNSENVLMIVVSLAYITLAHWRSNIMYTTNAKDTEKKFFISDRISLIIMTPLTFSIYFQSNGYLILFLTLLFFLIHSLPMVYRYDILKESIESEYR